MTKRIKGCLIGVGVIAVLCLCTPLLIGVMFAITSRVQYNADEPHKATHLEVTNTDLSLTLWVKQRPRAICYEGDYRVLEVQQSGRSKFYTLIPRSAGDDLGLAAFWFPTQQLIRVVDSAKQSGPQESVINLNNHAIVHVDRQTNGEVYTSQSLRPSDRPIFPPYSAKWSFGWVDSSDPSERDMLPRRGEYDWFFLRSEEPERVAPTAGVFVGMIEAKMRNDGQPTAAGDAQNRAPAP